MGQFSVEIWEATGSLLSGNQQVIPERYNLYLSRIGGIEALGTIDPALLANANLSLAGFGAAFYGSSSPAAIRQAALRVQDIVLRIGETEDVQESSMTRAVLNQFPSARGATLNLRRT